MAGTVRSRRLRWVVASLLLALGVGGLVGAFAVSSGRSDPTAIEAALASRRYADAVRAAERLTRDDPRDARAWFLLGRARAGAGDLAGAVDALEKVPEWSIRRGDADFFAAQLRKSLNRGREAEAGFRDYLKREARGEPAPLAASARLELMSMFAMEERFEAFRSMFWEVYPTLDLDDRLSTLTMRMRSEFEQSSPEITIELLGKFVAADPEDAQARAGLASAQVHAGRLDEALEQLRWAHRDRPDDVEIRARFLDALYRSGNTEELARQLEGESASKTNHATIANLIGVAAQMRGDLATAVEGFSRAVALRPQEPEYHHRLSQALGRLGRSEEAAAHAAERTRLTEAREALRKAWNRFADQFESDSTSVPAQSLWALSEASRAAGWSREADAWADLARAVAERGQRN